MSTRAECRRVVLNQITQERAKKPMMRGLMLPVVYGGMPHVAGQPLLFCWPPFPEKPGIDIGKQNQAPKQRQGSKTKADRMESNSVLEREMHVKEWMPINL